MHPAWLFPVPVRPSRFLAADAALRPFNVEVDLGRVAAFSFSAGSEGAVLFYDLQTQLDDNSPGRHGSGRSGVYQDRYLKGVGRTPAAANWSAGPDIYHGSGHLSVGSALRERLITVFLQARGLGGTIVPCAGVLLGALRRAESLAVRKGETSSREASTPADAHMVALTVKPADLARMSNFVFALDHFSAVPRQLGTLFLDLERYSHPPGEREGLEGAPDAIACALEAAFRRGLENFEAWAHAGLSWIYLQSNFSLDGRFLDLETPLYFGAPFVGAMVEEQDGAKVRSLVGFEEFGYVRHWRLFVAWLKSRLRLLTAPELLGKTASRHFLRELSRAIAARFSGRSFLFDDARLMARATANLGRALGLGPRGRSHLGELARHAFASTVYGSTETLPDAGWRPLTFQPAPATPLPRRFEAPAFFDPKPSPDGEAYAAALERLGSICEPQELLRAVGGAEGFVPRRGRGPLNNTSVAPDRGLLSGGTPIARQSTRSTRSNRDGEGDPMSKNDASETKGKTKKLSLKRQTVKDLEPPKSVAEKVKGGPVSKYGSSIGV